MKESCHKKHASREIFRKFHLQRKKSGTIKRVTLAQWRNGVKPWAGALSNFLGIYFM